MAALETPDEHVIHPYPPKQVRLNSTYILVLACPIILFILLQIRRFPSRRYPIWDRRASNQTFAYTPIPHTIGLNPTSVAEQQPPELEFVISYYNEPLSNLASMISLSRQELSHWTHRSIVYHKGLGNTSSSDYDEKLREFIRQPELKGLVDRVIGRKNFGRDGGTYLRHM